MLASKTTLAGRSLIGFREGAGVGEAMYATNPITGQRLQPAFVPATADEVELAVRLAAEAFDTYQRVPGRERGAFLRTIATKIESIAGEVIERAAQETALPQARLQGETARTCCPASAICAGGGRRIVGPGPHRPRRSRAQARAQARHSLHAAPARTGRCVRRQQLPAGIFRRRRRHRFRTRGRQYRNREGARGTSGHQRIGGSRRRRKAFGNAACLRGCSRFCSEAVRRLARR